MHRFMAPFVVVGLLLLAGCGPDRSAVAPTNIPPAPKPPPVGEKGPEGDSRASKATTAPPVRP